MVKIVQIICQISCADRAGGGNSSDWSKRENTLQIPFLSLSERLLLRTPFSLLQLRVSPVLKEAQALLLV